MNIGTIGAASILMRNNGRRGVGGGSSNNEPKEHGYGLLIFNILTFALFIVCMVMTAGQKDMFYEDVHTIVVDKVVKKAEGSKGKVYDDPYLKVERPNGELEWVDTYMKEYLNTGIGDEHVLREFRDERTTLYRIFIGLTIAFGLAWCGGAAHAMSRDM